MASVVMVTGPPGAGKSTLAGPLAAELGFPLLSKDVIKETLFENLGHVADDEQRSSQRLGAAAMELLWRLAGTCPCVVLEANFRPESAYEREHLIALSPNPIEVHCCVPIELAAARFQHREAAPGRHRVHLARAFEIEDLRDFEEPVGIGTVIDVDTTGPVDIAALATHVSSALGSGTGEQGPT